MNFTPAKVKKDINPSSIQGLAFRTIGAAMSTTPSMSVNINKDGSSSYVSMFGYLSESLPGPRWSWDGDLIGDEEREESPYENVESLLRRKPILPRRSVSHGHGNGLDSKPQRHSAESTPWDAPRPPIYENISDFIRSSEIELRYTSYDTLPGSHYKISSNNPREPMYESTPCLFSSEPLYDDTGPPPKTNPAALYDSIPCSINPPPLEDFHFRPLPHIKDKHGTLKKLFSLPKRFHRKKPGKLGKHPSMDALNEVPSVTEKQKFHRQNSIDMVVSVDGGNMDVHASIKQGSLTRHASVEVLLNDTYSQEANNQRNSQRHTRPPATPPPAPKLPASGTIFDTHIRSNSLENKPSRILRQQSTPRISEDNPEKTVNFQHELRIVLEQRFSQRCSQEYNDDGLRRAVSCSNLKERTSGPYDKPWDLKQNQLMPPCIESFLGLKTTHENHDNPLDTLQVGLRARSASMSDVSSQESLCSPKMPSTPNLHAGSEEKLEEHSRSKEHSRQLDILDVSLSKQKMNSSMVNLSTFGKAESLAVSALGDNKGVKSLFDRRKSRSMLDLTPQEELRIVLAKRAQNQEQHEFKSEKNTETEDHKPRQVESHDLSTHSNLSANGEENEFKHQPVPSIEVEKENMKHDGVLPQDQQPPNHYGQAVKDVAFISGMLHVSKETESQQDSKTLSRSTSLEVKPLPPKRTTSLRKTARDSTQDIPAYELVPSSSEHHQRYQQALDDEARYSIEGDTNDEEDIQYEEDSENMRHGDHFYSYPTKDRKVSMLPYLPGSESESDRDSSEYAEPPLLVPPKHRSVSVCQTTSNTNSTGPNSSHGVPVTVNNRMPVPEIVVTPQQVMTPEKTKPKSGRIRIVNRIIDTNINNGNKSNNVAQSKVLPAGLIYDVPCARSEFDDFEGHEEDDPPECMVKVASVVDQVAQYKSARSDGLGAATASASPVEFCYRVKELLPGIEDYLIRVLADEKLSEAAEKKRQYYSERLDVLKLAFPPTLPPRNEGDDYIAQQRELARLRGTLPPPSEFDDGEEYDSVEEPAKVTPTVTSYADQDDLYEEPVDCGNSAPLTGEERFSDTSYESYDDEEDSGALYINQDFHDHDPSHDPPLPRADTAPYQNCEPLRNKRKKDGVPAKLLPNVSVFGDLSIKRQWSWSKRYCILTEGRLLAFKSENATKSSTEVTLDGYDIMYLEKEAKRSHVIRISRPACETHFFSAETKDKADQWVEVLTAAACGGSGGSITTSGFNSAASSSPKIDKDSVDNSISTTTTDGVRKSSSLTDLSMTSEGSSGDGTIGQPQTAASAADKEKKNAKTDRKGSKPLLDSLSTFFGTLGKKKGEKVQQQKTKLAEMEEDADPEAVVSGYLTVYSDLMSTKKWSKKWCTVKQSILSVYREIGDESAEFSLPLPGCEVASACDAKHKMAVKIIEEGKEKITLDMPDTVAQGQWLNVLIHQTGCADIKPTQTATPPTGNGIYEDEDIYCDVDDDADLLKNWNFPKEMGLTADSNSTTKDAGKSPIKERQEPQKPPPLPSAPPPGVSVSKYLKTETSKQQNRAQRRTSIKRPTEAPPSVPIPPKAGPKRADSDDPKEVVKCHLGPTIDEDRDILEMTKNPILVQLRRNRTGTPPGVKTPPSPPSSSLPTSSSTTWKDSEIDKTDDDIAKSKKKLALIKKKRAELRSRKLACSDINTKLRYDDELRDLLRDQDNAEATLAKFSLKQAELQAQARKAKLEQESIARRESLSRCERQGSFSRLDKRESLSRSGSGEWDTISKRTGTLDDDSSSPRKFSSGASSPRSNGSGSPASSRKGNSLDRDHGTSSSSLTSSSPKSATLNSRNGLGGRGSGRTTRYTSDLTGKTTTRTSVTRTSSMSHGTAPGSPKGLRVTRPDEDDDRSPSPRGGRKQVQEKLKLWENISGTTDC